MLLGIFNKTINYMLKWMRITQGGIFEELLTFKRKRI